MKKKIIATFLVLGLLGFPILAPAQDLPPVTEALITLLENDCGLRITKREPTSNGIVLSLEKDDMVGAIELDSRLKIIGTALGFFPGKTNMNTFHDAQSFMYLALQTEMGKQLPRTKSGLEEYGRTHSRKMIQLENRVSDNLEQNSYTEFQYDDLTVTGEWRLLRNDTIKAIVITFTRNY